MDRAEAIRYLESMATDLTGACVEARSEKVSYYIERKIQAVDTAITALREQDVTDINVGNKWISVDERLPDKDALVLCIGAKGGMFLGFIRSYYECQNSAYTYVPNSRGCRYTTHWMPLPEPPKEGAEHD